jgi:hypothetical protein
MAFSSEIRQPIQIDFTFVVLVTVIDQAELYPTPDKTAMV